MNNIKAFIFDMDGVLLDSESICDITWEKAAKDFGLKNIEEPKYKCMGRNKQDSEAILKEVFGEDFDGKGFLAKTSEYFKEIEDAGGLKLLPYAKEILEYLKPKYKVALASSTRKTSVQRQMTNLGLYNYFEQVVTGDMVVHSKPDPEIYRITAEKLGVLPEECICVEDSPNGIKSAFSAGLSTIMVPDRILPDDQTKKMCNYIFKNLEEIRTVF